MLSLFVKIYSFTIFEEVISISHGLKLNAMVINIKEIASTSTFCIIFSVFVIEINYQC